MKKNWISCLAAAAVLMVSGALYAQDYTLSIAGETTLSGSAGDTVTETYTISMTTSASAVGAQGYTFGVSGVGATITSIDWDSSDARTLYAGTSPIPNNSVADCDPGGATRGAISAIVLNALGGATIPAGVTASLADVVIEYTIPSGSQTVELQFETSCVSTQGGVPVPLVVTENGASVTPSTTGLTVNLAEAVDDSFNRGDANDDGDFDIGDPIYSLDALFRGGNGFSCDRAADSNADDAVDLSDVMYSISYLFLSGPAPVAPSLGCGTATPVAALSCGANTCTAE